MNACLATGVHSLEPGSAIAWETGLLRATVIDLIETPDPIIAMLDVSFTAHMPDCLEMPYKPRIRGARDPKVEEPRYRMEGLTCLAGDFMGMGDYYFETPLQIGDMILFEDMIHYTMVKTSLFNGIQHPVIAIAFNNAIFKEWKTIIKLDLHERMSFNYSITSKKLHQHSLKTQILHLKLTRSHYQ